MKKLILAMLLTVASAYGAWTEFDLTKDAFERLRVASPTKVFDYQGTFGYDTQFVFQASGKVAWLTNESSALLTAEGGLAELRTRQYFRYQPASGQEVLQTFSFGSATQAICQVGLFDDDQGYFLQYSNGVAALVERTKVSGTVVENIVPQTQWNTDKFDGSGLSGINAVWSNTQISVWTLQWLGVGTVTHFLDINGKLYQTHTFTNHANALGTVYVQSINLPLTWRITTGANITNSMRAICSAVISSGGAADEPGYAFAVGNDADVGLTATPTPVIAIRPATTFSGITNRSVIVPLSVEILGGQNPAKWELYYGASATNGTWSAITGSAVEVNTNATLFAINSGRLIDSGFISANGAVNQRQSTTSEIISKLPMVLDKAGQNPIQLLLVVRSITGTPSVRAVIKWKELR